MSYKIKNGGVWVLYQGKWWLDSMLFMCYPTLKNEKLTRV